MPSASSSRRPCRRPGAPRHHEALAGGGGGATFIMDDGYCYGRSEEVLPAIRRFADRLTALGLHLQFRKCSFYSPRTLPSHSCGGPGRSASSFCSGCVVVSPASVALAWRPLHARRAVLHDLDAALSGRLRRGRCACPSPPLASRAHRGLWPHRRPLRICRARHRAFISPTAFEQARGGALGAGGGRVGFAGGGLF